MKVPTNMIEPLKTNNNLLETLEQKIEECVLNDKPICVCLDNSSMTCRNKINIETYEINTDHLYLNNKNFEVQVNFNNDTSITYGESIDNCFTIMQNDTELNLCFI